MTNTAIANYPELSAEMSDWPSFLSEALSPCCLIGKRIVVTGAGDRVDVRASAEGAALAEAAFRGMRRLARQSIEGLVAMQKAAVEQ